MDKTAVIILSGGMDSTVLAHSLVKQGYQLKALTFNYGQKHSAKELHCAATQARLLKLEHKIIDLRVAAELFGDSALTDAGVAIPSGHYTENSMKATIVPNRNMIMLSLAAAWAIALKFNWIAYAAHAGDHTIYPDCRPEFADAVNASLQLADWHKVSLLRPFVSLSKSQICEIGSGLDVSFLDTWSCYRGGDKHCGTCGTCVERKEAFVLAGIKDPTIYQ